MRAELAHALGAVPLVWLLFLSRKQKVDEAYWWLAAAFFVSFVADTVAHWENPSWVASIFPVSQAGLAVRVFIQKKTMTYIVFILFGVAIIAASLNEPGKPDPFLPTVSWLIVAFIVFILPEIGDLRKALMTYYFGGAVFWVAFCISPTWTTWSLYQLTRLAGILLFCDACRTPTKLRLV